MFRLFSSIIISVLLFLSFSASFVYSAGSSTNHYASSLTFQIEPREEQCFYEELNSGQQFVMEFEVVRGGLLDIRIKITDPSNHAILEKLSFFNRHDEALNEAEGKISISASYGGRYSICFDNSMSRWTPKVVSMFIPHGLGASVDREALNDDAAKLTDLGPMVDSIIAIADQLDAIEQHQHHARVRERTHRENAEVTNDRVQMWSVIESFVLIGITGWQLYYIRQWFKDAGKHGRV